MICVSIICLIWVLTLLGLYSERPFEYLLTVVIIVIVIILKQELKTHMSRKNMS